MHTHSAIIDAIDELTRVQTMMNAAGVIYQEMDQQTLHLGEVWQIHIDNAERVTRAVDMLEAALVQARLAAA